MADFLLEIGTEEIPAGMVYDLAANLGSNVSRALEQQGLKSSTVRPDNGPVSDFHPSNPAWRLMDGMRLIAAPRRIGFLIEGLPERQADREEAIVGPNLSIAKDAHGNWTKAAEGFARKQGIDVHELREVQSPKGPCAGFTRAVAGKSTARLLREIIPAAVEALYLPKAMRWGSGEHLFVRPVRWVVALLGDQIVPLEIKGVASGRASRGHRIYGASSIEIHSPDEYFDKLGDNCVIANPEKREARIKDELTKLAVKANGAWNVHPMDHVLLETLAFTCEYPTAFLGGIPEEFTKLPQPILSTCLREHQKSFAVYATEGSSGGTPITDSGLALHPNFLAVMDGPADPKGLIKKGNENVTISRLSDAKFFYDHDVKVPLERRLEELKGIVYHPKLGTYYDKALRIEALAKMLAPFFNEDPQLAGEAARICKADLASLLVQEKEFTSLQGIAGGLYAKAQGKDPAVARAISEHYGEPTPYLDKSNRWRFLSIVVALADKLDTLIEFFKIGLIPTGSKDPFGLRRAASQVVEMIAHPRRYPGDQRPNLDLCAFLRNAMPDGCEKLEAFILERARYFWENLDRAFLGPVPNPKNDRFSYDEINAILVQGLGDLAQMRQRLEALHNVRLEFPEDFDHLSVAHKRAKNLAKGQPHFEMSEAKFAPASDKEGAGERLLYQALLAAEKETAVSLSPEHRDYVAFLRRLASIRPTVDEFFDDVMVMCDPEGNDPAKTALQQNRLALLQRLVALFEKVADLSQIVPARGSNGATG